MWGRIANITSQIDAKFGADEAGGSQEESGATPTSGEGSGALLIDDQDGWGNDDDFDDELDFDEEPPDNGVKAIPSGENGVSEKEADIDRDMEVDLVEDDLAVATEGLRVGDSQWEPPGALETMEAISSEPDVGEDDGKETLEVDEVQPLTALPQSLPQSPPPNEDYPDIVTVSAPGKALIAGGYLVLDSPNPGVVLAAEGCQFHTTVTFRPPYCEGGVIGNAVDASLESIPLDVYSPQFDRVFSYYLSYSLTSNDEDVLLQLQPRTGHEPNVFVERSLLLTLGYLRQSLGAGKFHARIQQQGESNVGERVALAIKLSADNDFYSQVTCLKEKGLDLTPQNLEKLEPFLPCPKDESTGKLVVNKTGMGSSAALVTSVVGALLRFFCVISLPVRLDGMSHTKDEHNSEKEGLRIAHNLSQICHCHAQGKVGSGFDVSSAVYGSHIYTRFSKGVINGFLDSMASTAKGEYDGLQLSETLSKQLVGLVDGAEWDCSVNPISLPPGLELLMADVCGGSESPSMAKKILEWKKNKRRVGFMDDYYWKDLKRGNKKIATLLADQFTSQTFLGGMRRDGAMIISTRTAEQWKKPMPSSWHEFEGSSWDVALKLLDLRMAFLECRQNLKGMGKAAGVPVEPDEQSALADATMKLPGVVAAGVPGAGGYDALFVIYVKGPETNDGRSDQVRDNIGELWRKMNDDSSTTAVCPLALRAAGPGGGLCTTKLDW
ncbi:hypothetical protein ACHAWF_009224 [Thalassiosira exigua]